MRRGPPAAEHSVLLHFVSVMRRKTLAIGWISLLLFSGLTTICAQTQAPPDTDLGKKGPGAGVFRVGGGVSAPRAIYSPDPGYSEKARQEKYQGTCVLRLVVDTNGLPRNIRVERPIGMGLDEEAIEAVRNWRFKPAMKDGAPVAVQIAVEVSFHIDGVPKVTENVTIVPTAALR